MMVPTQPGAESLLWDAGVPYELAGTVGIIPRGPRDPAARVAHGTVWFAFNTPSGPATLHLSMATTTAVRATAWGLGTASALAGVPALLGGGDDWSGFDEPGFHATLPRLATQARRRHPGLRLPATGRMVDALIPAVLEQKVTAIEAHRGYRYLVAKFGSPAPGIGPGSPVPADLVVAPTPEQWARIPSWEWHKAGVGPQRSATVMRLLRAASALERLAAVDAVEAAAKLQTIPGIGIWTAAEATQRTHGDADAVAVGDYHLAKFVGWALAGKPVDDAGMLALLEPWLGHRQRVVRMLMLSGFRKPAFGPRMTIQDHRRH
ncbi:DNA-3-methyladenine glycosylase family protein [Arthrobacter sp. 35W]|uniref:DNA-3-methyladenine glycosylase family protein n=1 Tax=Arthrobacter sp. 35W TaxID=1132441 RepID=UPI000401C912|nr:3-methyladenine DNA glycosylase [Arthrobacter sp. 35W]